MLSLSKKVSTIAESQTLLLFARAKKMRADGQDVVSLTAGEPDFPTPLPIKQAAMKALDDNFTKYTPNPGMPELREAVANKFREENGIETDASRILVSSGAKQSVYNALQAICNKSDEVLIPAPYWVSYPEMVKLADAKPVIIDTAFENQFKLTPKELKKAITPKTKAIILCSPSNPTGAVYTRAELDALVDVFADSRMYIIADEIYEKIIYDGEEHISLGSYEQVKDRTITVNGVSKAYAMTGWRLGYMTSPPEVFKNAAKIQGQMTSNASSISQKGALAALTLPLKNELSAMVSEFDHRRRFLTSICDGLGIPYIRPKGAFYLFANVASLLGSRADGVDIKTADDFCEYMLTKHLVAMVPGASFGAPDWLRMSYACSVDELRKASNRWEEAVERLKAG
jgi:aspartate aminotransferase